jgi:hypothetical protein
MRRDLAGGRWRRAVVVVAVGVAAALLAACGSARAAPAAPQTGQQLHPAAPVAPQTGRQLRQALRDWSGFPVSASPRPLVLVASRVADPSSGFPDGAAKLAYIEAAINVPAGLPAGPATAAGFPLISASAAFRVLRSNAAKGPPAPIRLTVTTVRLGTGVFPTDRGLRQLPAWLFAFRGIQDPAAVLAVAPSRIFSPPGRRGSGSPFTSARLGPDGRTLTVEFTGAPAGTGPCTADYLLQQAASPAAVAVAVREQAHRAAAASGNAGCGLAGYRRQVTTVLSVPLGARVVIDAASGAAVAVAAPGG